MATVFTPPASCTTDFYRSYIDDKQYFDAAGPSPTAQECFPSPWQPDANYYYSALECPQGYYTATAAWELQGTVTATRATCCPSGYAIDTAGVIPPWAVTLPCSTAVQTQQMLSIYSANRLVGSTQDAVSAWWASSIQVRYVGVAQVPVTAGPGAAQTNSPANATNTSVSNNQNENSAGSAGSSNGGLSTGALVGIVVGAVIFGILLVLGIVALLMRRRRELKRQTLVAADTSFVYNKDGHDGTAVSTYQSQVDRLPQQRVHPIYGAFPMPHNRPQLVSQPSYTLAPEDAMIGERPHRLINDTDSFTDVSYIEDFHEPAAESAHEEFDSQATLNPKDHFTPTASVVEHGFAGPSETGDSRGTVQRQLQSVRAEQERLRTMNALARQERELEIKLGKKLARRTIG